MLLGPRLDGIAAVMELVYKRVKQLFNDFFYILYKLGWLLYNKASYGILSLLKIPIAVLKFSLRNLVQRRREFVFKESGHHSQNLIQCG